TETGALACVGGFPEAEGAPARNRGAAWLYGFRLKVRPGGPETFKDRTFGLEVYRDENTGNWVYVSEVGAVAVVPGAKGSNAPAAPKDPVWLHGLELKVRSAGDFEQKAKPWGVEVYRDENNGNLIYCCENGMVSVIPSPGNSPAPTDP